MSAKVIAVGNLTEKVEVINAIGLENQKVANFTLACRQGKTTEFLPFTAWNGVAEEIAKCTEKGSALYLEGKYKTKTWVDDRTQIKHSRIYFVIEEYQFLSKLPQNQTLPV